MSAHDNKAVAERLIDAWNGSDFRVIEQELVASDFVNHKPPPLPGVGQDRDGMLRYMRQAFPDGRAEPVNLVAETDKVVIHEVVRGTHQGDFMGVSPTERQVWRSSSPAWRCARRPAVRMRIPRSGEAYVLRVVAKTDQDTIATHQLTVIPSRVLPQSVVGRIAAVVAMINEVDVNCRRRAAGRFACTIKRWVGGRPWRGAMYLREDGLITFRQVHRYPPVVIFEPLMMVPDVILEE